MGNRVEFATNITLVVTCVVVTSFVTARYVETRQRHAASTGQISAHKIGEHFDPIPGVNYADASATLLLFLRTTCHFCTESMPFYERLSDLAIRKSGRFRVVALSSENVDSTTQYLRANHVSVDRISAWSSDGIHGTPTLILVDSRGVILGQWRGLLQKAGETEVVSRITHASP